MGFFGFSPSLKAKEQMWYSKNRGQSYLESIFDSVSNVHLILWQWHLDTKSCGYLSSSAFIWKASSSQSSSLWVNSLTSCCWAGNTIIRTIMGVPLGQGGHRVKLQALTAPTSKNQSNQCHVWLLLSFDGGVHWLLNFKWNLDAMRPLSLRHQCQLLIQVNAYPTWLTVVTWLMSTEARRLTSVNLCTDTGLVWMLM